jgi:hypothetical protein
MEHNSKRYGEHVRDDWKYNIFSMVNRFPERGGAALPWSYPHATKIYELIERMHTDSETIREPLTNPDRYPNRVDLPIQADKDKRGNETR